MPPCWRQRSMVSANSQRPIKELTMKTTILSNYQMMYRVRVRGSYGYSIFQACRSMFRQNPNLFCLKERFPAS